MNSVSSPCPEELLSELIELRRPVSFRSEGMSMHPFIRKGDTVTIVPYPGESPGGPIRVGDIVFLQNDKGRWFVHRLIRVKGRENIVTKGDSLLQADEPVSGRLIRGRVALVERNNSKRKYRLDGFTERVVARLIALLSRMEACIFSICLRFKPRFSDRDYMPAIRKGIKFPKWFLIRIFFP